MFLKTGIIKWDYIETGQGLPPNSQLVLNSVSALLKAWCAARTWRAVKPRGAAYLGHYQVCEGLHAVVELDGLLEAELTVVLHIVLYIVEYVGDLADVEAAVLVPEILEMFILKHK